MPPSQRQPAAPHDPRAHAVWFTLARKQITIIAGLRTVLEYYHAGRDVDLDWHIWSLNSEGATISEQLVTWQERQYKSPNWNCSQQIDRLANWMWDLMGRIAEIAFREGVPGSDEPLNDDGMIRGTWVGTEGCLDVSAEEDRRG